MKVFFAALMAFFTALSGFIGSAEMRMEFKSKGDIFGYAETAEVKKELVDFYTDEDGKFTVLQFSDTHFKTMTSLTDLYILEGMKAKIEKHDPDLVVICGDMIDDGNSGMFSKSYVLRTVAETFESLGQYWAYIPGNNDGINYGTSEDVCAYLMQYDHCLVSDEREISGGAQYSLDVYDSGSLTHSFIFMDTMDYDDEDPDHTYGYVHEDQVKWAEKEIDEKLKENPEVTVTAFLHENTPNFQGAAKNGEAYKKTGFSAITVSAEKYDIPKNQPLDDVFAESGCVGLVSIGHVHPAMPQCSFYEGTYYNIAQQATMSATLITINTRSESIRDMYSFDRV